MAEITITSIYDKTITCREYLPGQTDIICRWTEGREIDMHFNNAEVHKLADWIKENIPEPPPAPPEWRIETGDGEATLMINDYQAVWINKTGEFCGDSTASFSHGRITPELHKEMICALLEAHYELHKGES